MPDELTEIRRRYSARSSRPELADRYSFFRTDVQLASGYLDQAILGGLTHAGVSDFGGMRILELGCGNGGNLLKFLQWGAEGPHLVGNELLAERARTARARLPAAVEVLHGDFREMPSRAFDLVAQFTVLSSILSTEFRMEIASHAASMLAPGGIFLSYDLAINNPANPDVRKVTRKEIDRLFPNFRTVYERRVTLAPPLARRIGSSPMYRAMNAIPPLRSHLISLRRNP